MYLFPLAIFVIFSHGQVVGFIKDEGWEYGEFFFRLFPSTEESNELDKRIGDTRSVLLRLYERPSTTFKRSSSEKKSEMEYRTIDIKGLKEFPKGMNTSLSTMIIISGFMANNNASFTTDLISAASRTGRWNVFLLDWHKLAAGPWYPWAQGNVRAVGRYLANFLDSLAYAFEKASKRSRASFFKNLHVVGYSLGAHVAGVAGNHVKRGRIGRVTGLDPAFPLIERLESNSDRLDMSDAEFVDVIHTCGGVMGIFDALGHADFYPNGGTPIQPGCNDDLLRQVGCSHRHAWRFFAESILDSNAFKAVPCSSWEEFEMGECILGRDSMTNMGVGVSHKARGKYFLRTNSSSPYSMLP